MDMKDVHFLCRALGMSDTEKYLIWDELFCIKAVAALYTSSKMPSSSSSRSSMLPRKLLSMFQVLGSDALAII
jgi:hypothetical protein